MKNGVIFMKKLSVALIFGGKSSEHDISCVSAASILRELELLGHKVSRVYISKTGEWFLVNHVTITDIEKSNIDTKNAIPVVLSCNNGFRGLIELKGNDFYHREIIDCIFPCIHGQTGEDGKIQGLLEMSGLPYVGSGTTASAAGFDKVICNIIVESLGIKRADFVWSYADDYSKNAAQIKSSITETLGGYPVFVKPANAGSSIGITRVNAEIELDSAVKAATAVDKKFIIEKAVQARELECAILGNHNPIASGVGEVMVKGVFYDFDDKYKNGKSYTVIPADLPYDTFEQIRATSAMIYKALGCSGLARVDYFYDGTDVYFNEINTFPGFTPVSMYRKLFEQEGVSFDKLVQKLLDYALESAGKA